MTPHRAVACISWALVGCPMRPRSAGHAPVARDAALVAPDVSATPAPPRAAPEVSPRRPTITSLRGGMERHPAQVSPAPSSRVRTGNAHLRWRADPGGGAPVIAEVCHDPACVRVRSRHRSSAGHARVEPALAAGVWFWRVRPDVPEGAPSPTWSFAVTGVRADDLRASAAPSRDCDLDGDGRTDRVYTDQDSTNEGSPPREDVRWYPGGAGGFGAARVITSVAPHIRAACLGDVDGDGRSEVALFEDEHYAPRTVLLVGGTAAVGTVIDADAVGVGDVDGDGYGDIVLSNDTGTWFAPGSARGPQRDDGPSLGVGAPLAAGDVDGDGLADVVLRGADAWRVHRGRAQGPDPQPVASVRAIEGADLHGGYDVDGDGLADLVALRVEEPGDSDEGRGRLRVTVIAGATLRGDDPPRRTFAVTGFNARPMLPAYALGDFDGDGVDDLAAQVSPDDASSRDHHVRVVTGGASFGVGTRTLRLPLSRTEGAWPPYLRSVGDVNGDGVDDLGVQADCGWPAQLDVFRGGVREARAPLRGLRWGCAFLE